jgi:TetR/AcrR family transcriptional regulator, regulator of autoinduction and epiphytic fitness
VKDYRKRSGDADVNRPNRGGQRRNQARQTRRRMVAAAYELFAARGYTGTTMPAIAAAAGVHVQTLHYTFHTKANLLIEVIQTYADGADDAPPVMERNWITDALASPDGAHALALSVEHGTEIYQRVGPLHAATQTAVAIEPEVATFANTIATARRAGMRTLVAALAEKEQLRAELDVEQATDIHYVLHSHETYLGLVVAAGWTMTKYKGWLYHTLCHQLLTPRPAAAIASAARDMSFR